jgi:hypothetical protein
VVVPYQIAGLHLFQTEDIVCAHQRERRLVVKVSVRCRRTC